jgi:hypothetical protein
MLWIIGGAVGAIVFGWLGLKARRFEHRDSTRGGSAAHGAVVDPSEGGGDGGD